MTDSFGMRIALWQENENQLSTRLGGFFLLFAYVYVYERLGASCDQYLDIPVKRRILKLRSDRMDWLEPISDKTTGGNMVDSPPQFEEMTA